MNPIPSFCLGRMIFDPARVLRLEADRNYTWLYFIDGTKIFSAYTLAHYEKNLPPYFSRIHRAHYVNTQYIKSIDCRLMSQIELTDGSRLPIARRRWGAMKKELKRAFPPNY